MFAPGTVCEFFSLDTDWIAKHKTTGFAFTVLFASGSVMLEYPHICHNATLLNISHCCDRRRIRTRRRRRSTPPWRRR